MSKPQDAVKKAVHVAGLVAFLMSICPGLSSAGAPPVVRVEIEGTAGRLKLTYHVPVSRAEKPLSISINPGPVQAGAGLVVEHIAVNGTRKRQKLPPREWWFSKSQTLQIKSRELPTRFSVWVLPGMHLDFSELGIYRISYVHPWPSPDDGPDTPKFQSNTLTIACVTQERSAQLSRMLRQNPKLAFASYRFRNPPCVEHPKYFRAKHLREIAPAIRKGARRDEVLRLLGSPDGIYAASLGEQKMFHYDEAWYYETNPVRGYYVRFRNGLVVDSKL